MYCVTGLKLQPLPLAPASLVFTRWKGTQRWPVSICPHCQAPNPDDSQYCDQCSVPLKARPPGAALGPAGATLPAASVPPASARALGLGATSIPATVSVQP